MNEFVAILDERPFDLVTLDIGYRESILASFPMDPRLIPAGMASRPQSTCRPETKAKDLSQG